MIPKMSAIDFNRSGLDYVRNEVTRIDGRAPTDQEIGQFFTVWFVPLTGIHAAVGYFWKGLLLISWWGTWTYYFWDQQKYWPSPPVDPRPFN